MFSKDQISFISKNGINIDSQSPSDEDLVLLEEKIGDILVEKGLDKNYEPNNIGLMCESILDLLS